VHDVHSSNIKPKVDHTLIQSACVTQKTKLNQGCCLVSFDFEISEAQKRAYSVTGLPPSALSEPPLLSAASTGVKTVRCVL
jgi:hypothetical protein